jgi:hypothetical protein
MTSKLAIYNDALLLLGERKLSGLSEASEARRVMDTVWEAGAVDSCLEQALWNFAVRTTRLEYDASIEPEFGYQRAFPKPDDFLRTKEISVDEYFRQPLNELVDEAGFIFADFDQIYVRYISNDTSFGSDMSLWPRTFQRYVSAYLAVEACMRLTQSDAKYQRVYQIMRERLSDARSKDAMQNPTKFPPMGTWARSRFGRNFHRGDREQA